MIDKLHCTLSASIVSPLLVGLMAAMIASPALATQTAQPARPYLGLYARSNSNVLDERNAFDGLTVTRVIENSPAEAAGIKEGDILLQADGESLRSMNQLANMADALPIGTPIQLRIERDQSVIEIAIASTRRVAIANDLEATRAETWIDLEMLGIEFKRPDGNWNAAHDLAPRQGVVISLIAPRGPIREANIGTGSLLISLNGESIQSPENFIAALDGLKRDQQITIELMTPAGKREKHRLTTYNPKFRVKQFSIPLLYTYLRQADKTSHSIPFLFTKKERTEFETRYRFLWFFRYEREAVEPLLEMDR